jgi:hypothetical protein
MHVLLLKKCYHNEKIKPEITKPENLLEEIKDVNFS